MPLWQVLSSLLVIALVVATFIVSVVRLFHRGKVACRYLLCPSRTCL